MLTSPSEQQALRDVTELEAALSAVETSLAALGQALQAHDADLTEACADRLHQALTQAMRRFGQSAARGGVPPLLRRRLALATGQVAAQREAVARATTLLDRAIDILLPSPTPSAAPERLYGAQGTALRSASSGHTQA